MFVIEEFGYKYYVGKFYLINRFNYYVFIKFYYERGLVFWLWCIDDISIVC